MSIKRMRQAACMGQKRKLSKLSVGKANFKKFGVEDNIKVKQRTGP
jgi:hypothetical protein